MIDPVQQQYNMQSALQQQNIDAEQGLNAPYLLQQQQAIQAALVEQINPDRILREIKLTLRGEIETETGEVKKEGKPLMNDMGISNIILLARSVINQNTIMSALEDKEIAKLIIQLGDVVVDDLTLNWKEYGITDKIKLDIIVNIVLFPSYMALKRAHHGGERRFLGTTTIENINNNPKMMPQNKEGFWSRFKL